MNRFGMVLSVAVLVTVICFGQAPGPAAAQAAQKSVGHGAFPVKVDKTLDSSKLKDGDRFVVVTVGAFKLPDGTLVPKGSMLAGSVVAAKARSKGDPESQLSVTFDRLTVANGKELMVKGAVQAVFPPADEGMDPSMAAAMAASGGSARGAGAPGTVTNVQSGSETSSTVKPEAVADPKSMGVHGMDNLQLENGVLTSKGKNVKLGSGVRLVVRAEILG